MTSEQYQHILGTAQTLGKAKDPAVSPGLGGSERTELQAATASADSVRHMLAPLEPTNLAAASYSLERLRAAMRGLFACDDALLYIPRDPSAVLKASQRGTGSKRRSGMTPAFAVVDELDRAGRGSGGDDKPTMVPLLPEGVRSRTGLASVSGMEELCTLHRAAACITHGCSLHHTRLQPAPPTVAGERHGGALHLGRALSPGGLHLRLLAAQGDRQAQRGRVRTQPRCGGQLTLNPKPNPKPNPNPNPNPRPRPNPNLELNPNQVGKSARTVVRSMLCVPALLHRDLVEEVLPLPLPLPLPYPYP